MIEWKMDRSGGSCGSGISEPIGLVYLMEAIMAPIPTLTSPAADLSGKPQQHITQKAWHALAQTWLEWPLCRRGGFCMQLDISP